MYAQRDKKRARTGPLPGDQDDMRLDVYFDTPEAETITQAIMGNNLETTKRLWPGVPACAKGTVFYAATMRFYAQKIIDWILDQPDFDVNCRDHYGHTPLDLAYIACRPELVAKIESKGGESSTQLAEWYTAIVRGDMDTIKRIVAKEGIWLSGLWKSGKDFDIPVHWAAQSGQLEVLQYLVENGLCPTDIYGITVSSSLYAKGTNRETPLWRAAKRGHAHVVEWIIQQNQGKMGKLSWSLEGVSPMTVEDPDCLRLLLQCPDCDLITARCSFPRGATQNFKAWDIGDAACALITRSIHNFSPTEGPIILDISDNPRIGPDGLNTLYKQMARNGPFAKRNRLVGPFLKLTCSHIPPRWISKLYKLTHDPPLITVECRFPSLYTIALWNLVDWKNRQPPTKHPEAEWEKRLPTAVYQDFQNILKKT